MVTTNQGSSVEYDIGDYRGNDNIYGECELTVLWLPNNNADQKGAVGGHFFNKNVTACGQYKGLFFTPCWTIFTLLRELLKNETQMDWLQP